MARCVLAMCLPGQQRVLTYLGTVAVEAEDQSRREAEGGAQADTSSSIAACDRAALAADPRRRGVNTLEK